MQYVRVSWMVPRVGREQALIQQLNKLAEYYRTQPGYEGGFTLSPYPGADTHRYGRVGIWTSQDAAEAAAQMEHGMALRAELLRLVYEDGHDELSFNGVPDPGSNT